MKTMQPSLPRSLTKPDDIAELFNLEDSIAGVHIENTALTNANLEKTSISESLLAKIDFTHVEAVRFDVFDCELKGCNFTASKFPDSGWRRILIDGARCSGMQVTNSVLKHVTFKNSKLELVNFRSSRFENVTFEDCVLDDVDLYNAQLKNVEFINCTINNITFASARMANVDVSKSSIEGIKGINSLRGVTINYDQLLQLAPAFAADAGIKVK